MKEKLVEVVKHDFLRRVYHIGLNYVIISGNKILPFSLPHCDSVFWSHHIYVWSTDEQQNHFSRPAVTLCIIQPLFEVGTNFSVFRLKNWIAQQTEREREAAERKRRKLERLQQQPKHNFHDQTYEKERSQLTENVSDAVEKGTSLNETILYIEIYILIMIHASEPS